jgi:c-di-GMP-binding flagellar brake protein YcgR
MAGLKEQRKNKRVFDLKPTRVMLKGNAFAVSDISSGGMGVVLEDGGPKFFMGERLDAIPLPLSSGIVTVRGVVSHISVNDAETVCGIRFMFIGDEYDAVIAFKKERKVPVQ